ncbi:MAG: hypothetical protein IJR63_01870 [Synergistaceae bacterium]|nr:hypothetical protein [Synergistaceae bacterium]
MSNETIERGKTVLKAEEYDDDYESFHGPEFEEAMRESMAEAEDIMAHPEKYKFYDSVKEMLRDKGFDVSGLPDD